MVSVSDVEPGRCDGNPGGDPDCITKPTHIPLDDAFPGLAYNWAHGSTSPDQTEVLIVASETLGYDFVLPGVILYSILDARALEKGRIRVKRTGYSTHLPGIGYSYNSHWSHDGKMIAVAANDRMFVINSEDLSPMNGPLGVQVAYAGPDYEVHDAMFTADDKYIIMMVKFVRSGLTNIDSGFQLYNVAEQRLVGLPSSTCDACHRKTAPHVVNAEACAIDGKVKPVYVKTVSMQGMSHGSQSGSGTMSRAEGETGGLSGLLSTTNPLGPIYDMVHDLLPWDLLKAIPIPGISALAIDNLLPQFANANLDNLIGGVAMPSSPLSEILTMIPRISSSDILNPMSLLQGTYVVAHFFPAEDCRSSTALAAIQAAQQHMQERSLSAAMPGIMP